tara:strand:+ start:35704 stop:37047 length:1344 start_codon:yes stop_codon:yes gene_type:complete
LKAFETAIRNALQKADDSNPELRARIYDSARNALSNSHTKQGKWGSDSAREQTRKLEALINAIEADYQKRPRRSAAAGPKSVLQDVPPQAPITNSTSKQAAPKQGAPKQPAQKQATTVNDGSNISLADDDVQIGGQMRSGSPRPNQTRPNPVRSNPARSNTAPLNAARSEPGRYNPSRSGPSRANAPRSKPGAAGRSRDGLQLDAPERIVDGQRPDAMLFNDDARSAARPVREKRRRPFFAIILVSALVLAAVGIGFLWVIFSGLMLSPEQRDTSVPNPPATINGDAFVGNPSADGEFSGEWIDVFTPEDISRVAGRGSVKAALIESNGRSALQVVSQSPDIQGEVLFELGRGILDTLAGSQALVAMTLRSSTDATTQIYVKCQLPGGGDCGRRRFDVTYETNDIVFSLDLSNVRNGGGESGILALNSDVSGSNKGINIYAIRIRPQ